MTKTTRLIAPALFASLLLGAAIPASAASWNVRTDVRQEISQLDRQIDRALYARQISRSEAQRLDQSLARVQQTYRQYSRGGLNRNELQLLDRRIDAVKQQLRSEIRDNNRRPDRRDERGNSRGAQGGQHRR